MHMHMHTCACMCNRACHRVCIPNPTPTPNPTPNPHPHQVAHFEPEEVVVTAEGIYPRIAINLPRDESGESGDAFKVFVKQAADALAKQRADVEAFNAQVPY